MPAALITLALVAVATWLLRRAARRTEAAGVVLADVDPSSWSAASDAVRGATAELRDAVDRRLSR